MPEIDQRGNPWAPAGAPRHVFTVSRDLYTLLTVFGASQTIASRARKANVYDFVRREFEVVEVGRILTVLAATLRNEWDANPGIMVSRLESFGIPEDAPVGTLVPNIAKPNVSWPLPVRDSFNKILHCTVLNLDRSEGPSIYDGHLNPFVHLYGEHQNAEWRATLDVYRWADVVYDCDI